MSLIYQYLGVLELFFLNEVLVFENFLTHPLVPDKLFLENALALRKLDLQSMGTRGETSEHEFDVFCQFQDGIQYVTQKAENGAAIANALPRYGLWW